MKGNILKEVHVQKGMLCEKQRHNLGRFVRNSAKSECKDIFKVLGGREGLGTSNLEFYTHPMKPSMKNEGKISIFSRH